MPIADISTIRKELKSIPFGQVGEGHLLSMVNILSEQRNSAAGIKESIYKSVVPLLTSIEKNTRLIAPVQSIRKKVIDSKMVGPKPADDYKVSTPRTTVPQQTAPTHPTSKIELNKGSEARRKDQPTIENSSESSEARRKDQLIIENASEPKEARSTEASGEAKHKREKQQEQAGFADKFKDVLTGWDGNFFPSGGGSKSDDLTDAAGTAGGGVFWGAIKEVKEVVGSLNGDDQDDKSLTSVLKKTLMDKTGITTVKEKTSSAKEKAVEKVRRWASTGKDTEPLPVGYKKDKNGKLRNEKGHFISGPEKTLLNQKNDSGEDQVDALGNISDTLKTSDKEAQKRHDELVSTVASAGGSSGGSGLFGNILSGIVEGKSQRGFGGKSGKGKRSGKIGKLLSKVGGKFGKLGKLGKLGGIATAVLGGGIDFGGMMPSMLGGLGGFWGGEEDGERSIPTTSGKVASKTAKKITQKTATKSTSKIASTVSKFTGKGALKAGFSGAGKMLRVLGPLAAIATTGIDAYQGYNDKEMQSKAFGLKEGEEATGGQKTASAVANVLDLGGLVSGGLNMLGAEITTAGIAKGIYELFGGKGNKDKEAVATIQGKNPANPESMQTLVENAGAENVAGLINSTQPSIDKLAKQVERLALSLDPQKSMFNGRRKEASKEAQPIMTEFDDTTLTLMAHDRL